MAGSSSVSSRSSSYKGPSLIPLGHHTGKPPIPLHRPVTIIGSRSNARIHLTSSSVSKAHALVVKDGPVTYIRDLASRTHVYISGEKIREHDLEDGELIKIGSFTFKFVAGNERPAQATATHLPTGALRVSGVDYPVPIDQRVLLIGRRSTCDVHLLEDSVSTAHAVLFDMNGQRHIRDLGSRTGTFVNGVQVHQHQLNDGDKVRIGETTLTYSPGEALVTVEDELSLGGTGALTSSAAGASAAGASAAGASRIPVVEDFVVDDAEAKQEAEQQDEVDLSPPAVPHVAARAGHDEQTIEELEPLPLDEAPTDPTHELSAGVQFVPAENLRASEHPSDSEGAAEPEEPEAAQEADLLPRRGWRGAAQSEAAEATAPESTPESMPAPAEPTPAPEAGGDEDLLKFTETSSADDAAAGEELDLSPIDAGHEPAASQEPEITAGEFASPTAATEGEQSEALAAPEERPEERAEDERAVTEPLGLNVETGATAAPSSLEPVVHEEMTIDSSTLRGDAGVEEPLIEQIQQVEAPAPSEPAAPLIAPDALEPAPAEDAPPPPSAEKKPRKRRSRKKQTEEEAEAVQPTADAVPGPSLASAEVLEPTEPTPESALDLTAATGEVPLDEAAIADVLDAPAPLTDTQLGREVADLTGDAGQIVEPPPVTEEPVTQEPAAEPVAEAPAPAAAPAPPSREPAAARHGPAYRFGANQDNFLGGVPVKLPPLKSPFADRGIVPSPEPTPEPEPEPEPTPAAQAPEAPPVEPVAPVASDQVPAQPVEEPAVLDLSTQPTDAPTEAAEQIEEVNALIDEILAPTASESKSPEPTVEAPPSRTSETAGAAAEAPVPPIPLPSPPPIPAPPVPPPAQSRPVIPIPPPPGLRERRGKRRGEPAEAPAGAAARGLRDDERIPPYKSIEPATASRITRGFDGLAMPPVRETDVFSQMSPPAAPSSTSSPSSSTADAFGADVAPSPSALTPMDLIQAEESPPRSATRPRRPLSGRTDPPVRDIFLGVGPSNAKPAAPSAAISKHPPIGAVAAPTEPTAPAAPAAPVEPAARQRPAVPIALPKPVPPPIAIDDEAHKHVAELGLEDFEAAVEQDQAQAQRRPPVVYDESSEAGVDPDLFAHDQRKRKLRRVPMLLGAMIVLMGVAAAASWFLVPVKSRIEAGIRFENFNLLKEFERKNLRSAQQALLNADHTRMSAKRLLNSHDAEISPGFLDDNEKYLAVATTADWFESRKGAVLLRYDGADVERDKARLKAMAEALVEANGELVNQARDARKKYDNLEAEIQNLEQRQRELGQEIEKLRTLGDSAPNGAKIQELKDEVARLERAWGDALAAQKLAQSELDQLKQSGGAVADQPPAGGAEARPSEADSDDQIKQMQGQLTDASEKLKAAQAARAAQADAARQTLDVSLADFQKQIVDARELMKDSPELAAYISSAQKLQETTRTLIDDLIRRQENYQARLNDLKQQLVEKMERRRAEQLRADPELKDWNERLQTARRQYNAAKASGLKKESEDAHAQVALLENMIKNKQELLPGDTFYAEAISQLQKIIDATQQNVEDDRKRTDQVLTELQKGFTNSTAVARLPDAQKSVASGLEKRLADINAARQQYSAAMSSAGTGDEDEATKALRTQVASIQASIDARHKQLAEANAKTSAQHQQQNRADLIAAKEKEVLDKTQAENTARQMFTNKERELREAQALAETVRGNEDRLRQLQSEKQMADRQIADARNNEATFKQGAERAVKPAAISDSDVSAVPGADHRLMYALGSCAAIFLAFAVMIVITLHGAAQEMSLASLPRAVPPPPSPPLDSDELGEPQLSDDDAPPQRPAAPSSSNGQSNGQPSSHDEPEEHEPATI
jgi:pSer/pThr/pTyr-binding forkhead associated (FHA) protein